MKILKGRCFKLKILKTNKDVKGQVLLFSTPMWLKLKVGNKSIAKGQRITLGADGCVVLTSDNPEMAKNIQGWAFESGQPGDEIIVSLPPMYACVDEKESKCYPLSDEEIDEIIRFY